MNQARPRKHWLIGILAFLFVAGVLIESIVPRVRARTTLRVETAEMAVPTVSVVRPQRSAPTQEVVLPGNVQPFITAPIYSRTNGYLKAWYVDIGARVHKGQLLAEIETPEVDQQLRQSLSNLSTAEANLRLAGITKDRYEGLLKTNAVAQQDVDNAVGTYNANKAIVEANEANVKQLQALQSFEKIYAPFDGIVTARNTDIGDLIQSGSSGGTTTDLFHISQPGKLRVYVNVPQDYSQAAKPGLTADLTLPEFPGRRFQGKLVRTANAINLTTRTLLTEIDVDNPDGTLLSGAYAEVHLKLPGGTSSYILPVSTLLFRSEGLRVAVVKDGKVVLTPITPGHDFGDHIEIASGLQGDETVVVNPPDSLVSGQQVRIPQSTETRSLQ
ncbi:MAG: efflux RND transporter periplasmic adaptor subunit [Acidobacteriia bacterium]|nr:efflux RND transporter periplasmic adaptor subunit [Terriglobia bacterium]